MILVKCENQNGSWHFVLFCRFLGYVDKIGTAFEAKEVATGFGVHLAVPMIREAREKKQSITRDEAHKVWTHYLYFSEIVFVIMSF